MALHALSLVSRFDLAGLRLSIASAPLARTSTNTIVQLDIARGRNKRDEHFRLWPGAGTNRVEVQGVDRDLEQLVLMIHEPRRRFEVEVDRRVAERTPDLKIVRVNPKRAWVERFTDDRKRHFLCGMDEQHCFIAQLPQPVSTVAQAHGALKPPLLNELLSRAKCAAVRQGEFFFVPVSDDELKRYAQLGRGILPRQNLGIAQAAGWARAGRPHVADEVWSFAVPGATPAAKRNGSVERLVLVKGHVRHPDHKTVRFTRWMRVLQNLEAYEAPPPGILWVD